MIIPKTDRVARMISDYVSHPSLVAVTGGGGKTSLLFSLARYLQKDGSVLVTTTTKIGRSYPCGAEEYLISEKLSLDDLRAALSRAADTVVVGDSVRGPKLIGVAPEMAVTFFSGGLAEHVLAECDGSRGLPFKAYEDYEPVIPSCATLHIVVAGSEILYAPLSSENVFRFDLLKKRWGINDGEAIPIETLARILESPSEYLKDTPKDAARLLLFNKCDLLFDGDRDKISETATKLARRLSRYDALAFVSLKDDRCY
ncbi:MAG: putative selenium-dependent hydroxylase accessory protein YqeC, partial [Synergistaceae bacterium]|nr:putative selenium-dependent hydroxylase accessory protein YqeC [Synergistaceae bacterium]